MKNVGFVIPRVILGGIFIVSGYQKLMEGSAVFAAVIRGYEIVGGPIAEGMAAGLPWVELVLGVFLVLGLWRRTAILGLWAFNMAFIAALLSAIVRKIPLENCGCFGNGSGVHFTPIQPRPREHGRFEDFLGRSRWVTPGGGDGRGWI
jgi:hypothetical protein